MIESLAPTSSPPDHVIGRFARETLGAALAATHRSGFGAQTRVIDGARGSIGHQIERLGLRVQWSDPPADDAVLIVVSAPGRVAIVAELFDQVQAEAIWLAYRNAGERSPAVETNLLQPDVRIREGTEANSGA